MNEYIKIILNSIISSGVVLVVLKLIGEGWINHLFQKQIKKLDATIAKDLASYNSVLDTNARRIQAQMDIQSEQIRIQYSTIFTQQLEVYKEVCKQMNHIFNLYNRIQSFYSYDCRPNIDFSKKRDCGEICDENCIINYWDFVVKFKENVQKLSDYIDCNEMYFSLSQTISFLKIEKELIMLGGNAIKIGTDIHIDENQKATKVLKLFNEYDMTQFIDLKNDIVNSFRERIGTLSM